MSDSHDDFASSCIALVLMTVAGIATIVLAIMKTVGVIDLPWVMVFAPIWALPILVFAIATVVLLAFVLWAYIPRRKDKEEEE